jgi:hypothetical protein
MKRPSRGLNEGKLRTCVYARAWVTPEVACEIEPKLLRRYRFAPEVVGRFGSMASDTNPECGSSTQIDN